MSTRIIGLNLVHLIDRQAMNMPTKGRSLESPYLKMVFQQLLKAGLKIEMRRSIIGQSKIEYLGYGITQDEIQPIAKLKWRRLQLVSLLKCIRAMPIDRYQ
jgi:hypothetical protein